MVIIENYMETLPPPLTKSKFRSGNQRIIRGLFFEETLTSDKSTVLYTLKDRDHMGFPSLYRLYMALSDPLEHEFAETYFECWEHWEQLCECEWFKPLISRWRKELDLVIRSTALKMIREEAESGTANSYQANKLLLQGGWKGKEPLDEETGRKRGRPSKAEILKAADELARDSTQILKDAQRLGLQ